MDKKNLTIGVLLIIAAFASLYVGTRLAPTPPPPAPVNITATSPSPLAPNRAGSTQPAAAPSDATFAALAHDEGSAQTVTLGNDFVEVQFTDRGGAINQVSFKKYPAKIGGREPYVFNGLHVAPMLAFTGLPGLDRNTTYALVSRTGREVVYRAVYRHAIEVTRRYTIYPDESKAGDPYLIRSETTFRNLTAEPQALPRLDLNLGTAEPIDSSDYGYYLDVGYYNGKSADFIKRSSLQGGGLLSHIGIGSRDPVPYIEKTTPVAWASVKNQFFTSIYTPDRPGVGIVTRRVQLPPFAGSDTPDVGVTGVAEFAGPELAAHGEAKFDGSFFVGPKEYRRLANEDVFKLNQDKIMQFGFFGFFSKLLLTIMTWFHDRLSASWGIAIIGTTLLIRAATMPFTLAASRSSKRMAKIQPQMKELREKYKDNPQKQQAETMKLFKENKVNPLGGCVPMVITIPIFFGFFEMLRSVAELRFAPFLWAHDLSAPDTVARIHGIPINIWPILMGVAMIFQMRLVPQPAVDNAQTKMFKFMPIIFAFFCYNYSCALSLYYTFSNLFTIIQQLIINRMKDDPIPAAAGAAGGKSGSAPKNVTPPRKKLRR